MASNDNVTESKSEPGTLRRYLQPLVIPVLAIITALAVGAIIIIFTAGDLAEGVDKVIQGYYGMFYGAFLKRNGLLNTLVATTPLILTGLAVAIPFRAGLFNIGAEGQFLIGALVGTLAGIYIPLPPVIHVIFVLA